MSQPQSRDPLNNNHTLLCTMESPKESNKHFTFMISDKESNDTPKVIYSIYFTEDKTESIPSKKKIFFDP